MNEEIKEIECQIRELSIHLEVIEAKIGYTWVQLSPFHQLGQRSRAIRKLEKEVKEETKILGEQTESTSEQRRMLYVQLKSLQSEKTHLSQELGYLHHRMKSIIRKLSSLRDQNLSDQKEDQSRVRGKIARMPTRRKPPTRKIHAREPDWRPLYK